VKKVQASIAGFGRPAATVYGMYDDQSGHLVVTKIAAKYRADRFGDSLLISNQMLDGRDVVFSEDLLQEAIGCYFEMVNTGRLTIEDAAQHANPQNQIEQNEVKESGRSYRLQSVTDAQVATLAMCHYVKRASTIANVLSMQDALLDLTRGTILSI
jgi:hypothetical protein